MMGVGAKRALGLYRSCAPRQRSDANSSQSGPASTRIGFQGCKIGSVNHEPFPKGKSKGIRHVV